MSEETAEDISIQNLKDHLKEQIDTFDPDRIGFSEHANHLMVLGTDLDIQNQQIEGVPCFMENDQAPVVRLYEESTEGTNQRPEITDTRTFRITRDDCEIENLDLDTGDEFPDLVFDLFPRVREQFKTYRTVFSPLSPLPIDDVFNMILEGGGHDIAYLICHPEDIDSLFKQNADYIDTRTNRLWGVQVKSSESVDLGTLLVTQAGARGTPLAVKITSQ